AADEDEAGLRAARLAHVRDRDDVDVDAVGAAQLREVHGELAGVDDRLGRRIAAPAGAQDHVAPRARLDVEEEVAAGGEARRQEVVRLVAAPDPDLELAAALVAPRREARGHVASTDAQRRARSLGRARRLLRRRALEEPREPGLRGELGEALRSVAA